MRAANGHGCKPPRNRKFAIGHGAAFNGKVNALAFALMCVLCVPLAAAESLLLSGADVYPVVGETIAGGDLLIRDGKIAGVGPAGTLDAGDARKVDYRGKRIYPGLIHANSVLGLTEIEAVRATNDFQEVGPLNANSRAEIAINPDSELIPVTRNAGIVAVHVAPQGSGALFTGQSAVVQLSGWTWEQMSVRPSVGVHLMWPSSRLPDWLPPMIIAEAKKTAADNLKSIDSILADARRYATAQASGMPATDLRLAAMVPVLERKQRLFVHADDLTSLRQSIELCRREKLDCVLVGASDGWRLSSEIASAKIPVILGSPFTLPSRRHEGFDTVYRNAARLYQAGVTVVIAGDGTSFAAPLEKNLAHHAAQTVAYGLPADIALQAITINAAGVLGIADRLGSIELRKDASLMVTDGDPLELTTKVAAVYIQGVLQSGESRHERLYQRYKQRLPSKP